MAIPKHDEVRLPALKLLTESEVLKTKDFVKLLADYFKLTDEEASQMYPSANGHIFYDRVTWALSYLSMAGLVEKPARGTYKITPEGVNMLGTPDQLNEYIDKKVKAREIKNTKQTASGPPVPDSTANSLTPQEELDASYQNIRKSLYDEILETILSKKPVEFERLVVKLLQRMGYGGEVKDSGTVTKLSNDGGIDGIIKEDILGLGRIHIQAKRYKTDTPICREDIQRFAGALAVAQSNKGVFITTSYYSKGALEYVQNLNGATTIVLINGRQLAEYMYDFGLGVQTEQVIELKKLDTDFWDSMLDDKA